MCWNQTRSLNTFIFTLFGINFAYLNNVITINDYIYYLLFSSILKLQEYKNTKQRIIIYSMEVILYFYNNLISMRYTYMTSFILN